MPDGKGTKQREPHVFFIPVGSPELTVSTKYSRPPQVESFPVLPYSGEPIIHSESRRLMCRDLG